MQPRSRTDEVAGERQGAVLLRLRAAPVDGAANAALVRFIAARLGLPQRSVRLLRGQASRHKWVVVEGYSAAALRTALLGSPAAGGEG